MFGINIVTGQILQPQIALFLERKLKPHLPSALPLYRRCQYHLTESDQNERGLEFGRIWATVASPKARNNDDFESWLAGPHTPTTSENSASPRHNYGERKEWLAAYIDLSNPGETQVWLFGSWESELNDLPSPAQKETGTTSSIRAALFERLYNHIRQDHIPQVSIQPTLRWQRLLESGKLISVPYNRSKVLFGTISEHLWQYFQDNAVYGRDEQTTTVADSDEKVHKQTCITRQDLSYFKYIIPTPMSDVTPATPSGFRYGPLTNQHLQLMLDRSAIPRTLESLQSLVSVGLFSTKDDATDPIAWGMLSKDASLSSLHTEEPYRGRGLAQSICQKLATLQSSTFRSDLFDNVIVNGQAAGAKHVPYSNYVDHASYLHADVSESNTASRRVCEKLGGTTRWKVGWIEVDLGDTITYNYSN